MCYFISVSNPPNDWDKSTIVPKLSVALGTNNEWKRFGMRLLGVNNTSDLDLISQNPEATNLTNKCMALLELWMKRTAQPKWENVIQALNDIQLFALAAELERALKTDDREQPGKLINYSTIYTAD